MLPRAPNFDEDTKSLFEQLKFDKTQTSIDKSTLQALLLYCDVDKIDPFFFNSLNKKIEGIKAEQLTYSDFIQVFDFARDPFPRMTVEELAQLFTMFDPTNKQEISAQDFLKIYQDTPEGRANPQDYDNILKDFELLDPVRKSISPEEFLKILNIQNQPNFQNPNQSAFRGGPGFPGGQPNYQGQGVYQSQGMGGYGSPDRINQNSQYNPQGQGQSQFGGPGGARI